ncbi:hypothetical protein WDW86_04995 [Bdellovibrionota bacterium FG-2]
MNSITVSEIKQTLDVVRLCQVVAQSFKGLFRKTWQRFDTMNRDSAEIQRRIELSKTNWDSANGYYSYLRDFR